MKLKFRAEPKDLLVFSGFCVALLYVVAIAVLNLASFANDTTFHGFNPLPAFSKEYIVVTLVAFFIFLAVIIASVSSHFFEFEKGIGITTKAKKEKGYSRWAKDKEMQTQLKKVFPSEEVSKYAGIPIINNGKELWVDDSEYHNLIIGSTGSGKTQITVLPLVKILAKKGESMVVTDPKGEIYEQTSNMLREKGYNVVLLNFRDPQKGNSWNPLTLPYKLHKSGNKDKANELLDDLAMNILYDEKSQNQDPFWEKTSADYFAGLSLALFDDATEEEINLNSINLMSTLGEEKIGGTTYIKEYFNSKDPSSPAYINASSTLMSPTDTKGSILAVFKQKIKLFSSRENLSEMLSYSDFEMEDIGRKKTAVFIVIQDEKKTYHSLVTIFIKQCYETLIDVAQESGGKLTYRTNFILDEFANMPPLKDVTTMVTAARSRKIRFNFIIQNFSQLNQVYGNENGETIKGNCGNIIYLISSEIKALEEISKMCGEVKSKEKDKTASTPLITVSDLQRLKEGEIVVLRTRMMPFKTKMIYDYKMDWGKKYEKAPYPYREKRIIKLFDIKGFVNKIRDEKMNNLMGNFQKESANNSPFMNPNMGMPSMPMNPFGAMNEKSFMPDFSSTPGGGFNIDELVKKIDDRIAELEEEEKREKEKNNQTAKTEKEIPFKEEKKGESLIFNMPIEDPLKMDSEFKIKKEEEITQDFPRDIKEKEDKNLGGDLVFDMPIEDDEPYIRNGKTEPIIQEKKLSKLATITDDQFFDDFFEDDME